MPDTPSPSAILPLSVLEAIRNLDTPVEDGLEGLADEMVSRRLGLSATVAAQITRYKEAVSRRGTVSPDEVVSVLRLVSRRPDAALAFADAGRRAARYAIRGGAGSQQTVLTVSPGPIRSRLARRAVRRLLRDYFQGELVPKTEIPELRMPAPLSIAAVPDGAACGFYGAAFGELLRMLTGFEGATVHELCRGRGDSACIWRAHRAGGYE
ncbi:MAG TPA: hypothetical protein VFS11_01140 [Gemmatimonadales bacterium]|nr:hypothetical protein [Gemmatimonadales bacterium]